VLSNDCGRKELLELYDLSNFDCSNSKEDMSACPHKKRNKVQPDNLVRKPAAKRAVTLAFSKHAEFRRCF
jgi:hypothetical protein